MSKREMRINPTTHISWLDVSWYRFGKTKNGMWYLVVYTVYGEYRIYEERRKYIIQFDATCYNGITKLEKIYRVDVARIEDCYEIYSE